MLNKKQILLVLSIPLSPQEFGANAGYTTLYQFPSRETFVSVASKSKNANNH